MYTPFFCFTCRKHFGTYREKEEHVIAVHIGPVGYCKYCHQPVYDIKIHSEFCMKK